MLWRYTLPQIRRAVNSLYDEVDHVSLTTGLWATVFFYNGDISNISDTIIINEIRRMKNL